MASMISIGIYRLVPRGGVEERCVRIATMLAERGNRVELFTTCGSLVQGVECHRIGMSGWPLSNHARMRKFARLFEASASIHSCKVGFQPMPGLDVLYCGDRIRNRKQASFLKKLTPRFRTYAQLEAACFSPDRPTRILCPGRVQANEFVERYGLDPARITVLPPSLDPAKHHPERRSERLAIRKELGVPPAARLLLWCGLQPRIKGLDRVIEALAHVPAAWLAIGGLRENDRQARAIRPRIEAAGISRRIIWLGYLSPEKLVEAFAAADVLAHPARQEVAGAVILEALVNGLPVVTTENCGYAAHVQAAEAGIVLPGYTLQGFVAAIEQVLKKGELSANGIRYGRTARLDGGLDLAADIIESAARTK